MRKILLPCLLAALTARSGEELAGGSGAASAMAVSAAPEPLPAAGPEACAASPGQLLHVASPDWREQVIYMLMIDRFNDGDPYQEHFYSLGMVNDINTGNPEVIAKFKEIYKYWIDEAGVDAFRMDTAMRGSNAMLGYPLYHEINRVLARGAESASLAYRLGRHMDLYPDPYTIPNFIDNHDTARFLAAGHPAAFRQALALLFTIPGIPIVYQGTDEYSGPGLLAYRREQQGESVIVLLNTAAGGF